MLLSLRLISTSETHRREIVKSCHYAEYGGTHTTIKNNNVNVLSAIRAAAKSEDVDLLYAALALRSM